MVRNSVVGWLLVLGVARAEESKLSPQNVSVTGTAVVRAQPDIVAWQVTVRRTKREIAKAQADCNDAVKKVLALRGQTRRGSARWGHNH